MNPEHLARLEKIIADNDWADLPVHPKLPILSAISEMCDGLRKREIDLILDLLQDYLIIKNYTTVHFDDLLQVIDASCQNRPLMITPVGSNSEIEETKIKSGHFVHYGLRKRRKIIRDNDIIFCDDPKSRECQEHKNNNGTHISVDDFIGSGEQFLNMIKDIEDSGLQNPITHIATLCIQEEAKELFENLGYIVLTLHLRPKALKYLATIKKVSDDEIYREYDALESKTGCPGILNKGWGQSEAAVTMMGTPDCTLPIFWWEDENKREDEKQWRAPFPN